MINPNGLERAIEAHFRKTHCPLNRAINVTVLRHDGKPQNFQIQGPKRTGRKPNWVPGGSTEAPLALEDRPTAQPAERMEHTGKGAPDDLSLSEPSDHPADGGRPSKLPAAHEQADEDCKTGGRARGRGKGREKGRKGPKPARPDAFHEELLGRKKPAKPKQATKRGASGKKCADEPDDTSNEDDPQPESPQPAFHKTGPKCRLVPLNVCGD